MPQTGPFAAASRRAFRGWGARVLQIGSFTINVTSLCRPIGLQGASAWAGGYQMSEKTKAGHARAALGSTGSEKQWRTPVMATRPEAVQPVSWWREPTGAQWLVYVVSWLGWTLEALDFMTFQGNHLQSPWSPDPGATTASTV